MVSMLPSGRISAFLVAGISAAVSLLWFWQSFYSTAEDSQDNRATEEPPITYTKSRQAPVTVSHDTTLSEDDGATQRLWVKLVSATRDVSDLENLSAINVDQWDLALNEYGVGCEPGLSKQVFMSMSSHERRKSLTQEDFIAHVRALLNTDTFTPHVQMPANEVLLLSRSEREDMLVSVICAKIISALLNNETFDSEILFKEQFEITDDMQVEDLLVKLSDCNWEIRVQVLEHIHQRITERDPLLNLYLGDPSDELSASSIESDLTPISLLSGWTDQFSDNRSQLVKYSLTTFPDVIDFVLEGSHNELDLTAVFEALFVPVRAKRSAKIQEWGHECCEKVISVVLRRCCPHYSDASLQQLLNSDEEDVEDPVPTQVIELIQIFSRNIVENNKHERVRQRCVAYLSRVIQHHSEFGLVKYLFDNAEVSVIVVDVLNVTLLDKKAKVRTEAFEFMKMLEGIIKEGGFENAQKSVQDQIFSKIDEKARDRYSRSSSSRKRRKVGKKRRSCVDIASYRNKMRAKNAPAAPTPHPLVRSESA